MSTIMNNEIVDMRLKKRMAEAFLKESRRMVEERLISISEGYNLETSVIDRFPVDSFCEIFNFADAKGIVEWIAMEYELDFDYTPN